MASQPQRLAAERFAQKETTSTAGKEPDKTTPAVEPVEESDEEVSVFSCGIKSVHRAPCKAMFVVEYLFIVCIMYMIMVHCCPNEKK